MVSKKPSAYSACGDVFWAFLLLGLTSFGGPVAHLGYFRTEFVERRRWLSEQDYADLVALCQFLPGPASSQVGFALGLMRAGYLGAIAAWVAFTLPSASVLVLFALGSSMFDGPLGQGLIHGLKVTAVAIVAHAVWGMARNLCPDARRAGIALAAVFAVVFISGPLGQVVAISIGAIAGMLLCRAGSGVEVRDVPVPVSARVGNLMGLLFIFLLFGLPFLAWVSPTDVVVVLDAFYRAGALVFGGGHVVLPLLESEVVASGWVSAEEFLTGYGATQAVPGPLFTFAAYLGWVIAPLGDNLLGAVLALATIFIPGMLLLVAVLPHWGQLRRWRNTQALMRGANAAVVGILGAALYQPVWTSAIHGSYDFALALAGFVLLSIWKVPAWVVVGILAGAGVLIAML
ncbi:chromate efflux transporter [Halomonas halocynthiae]|uniref:chromate efflux transporter n=1 Tax=Halomonas halocynthiae TaxID=176290 RepID=UPI00040F438E|nr:chromate efflux transporter [Halomonas halocynthiae]